MRVIDPAWIGMKLRKLTNYAEPLGQFMAFVPGLPHGATAADRPSTVATWRGLIIHRYAMLGILNEEGFRYAIWGARHARAAGRIARIAGQDLPRVRQSDDDSSRRLRFLHRLRLRRAMRMTTSSAALPVSDSQPRALMSPSRCFQAATSG